jgi:protein gp37
MAENSLISWTDHTWNPWRGCTKVSPACANCYAEALSIRYGLGEYKKGVPRIRTSEANWKKPYVWNKKPLICNKCQNAESDVNRSSNPICGNCGGEMHRARVFSLSLGDWLDDEVPIEWLADMLKVIHDTPNLDWLLLTKRPENFQRRILHAGMEMMGYVDGQKSTLPEALPTVKDEIIDGVISWSKLESFPPNVWIGTTVENQEMADKRIPELLKIPAKVRFLSCEPLLDRVWIEDWFFISSSMGERIVASTKIRWVIAGGESGEKRREMNMDWLRSLHDQCKMGGVAFWAKQDSGHRPGMRGRIPDELWVQEFPD